jgi:predicted nucleic acid-binding protein
MIIDTMVMAYALLGVSEFKEESLAALHKARSLQAPASVMVELLNVVWRYGRQGADVHRPAMRRAADVYADAARLWTRLIPVEELWPEALSLAFAHGHSPYDTLFIAAARLRGSRAITYDRKLLTLFPDDTIRVRDFLA